jgi:hypothetical protein
LLAVAPVRADQFVYPDLSGADVMFSEVSEDTTTGEALFGAPQVIGNTLDFDPVNFLSESSDGSNIVDSQLSFVVSTVDDPLFIDRIRISERGDYELAGVGEATAFAAVQGKVFWDILEINGVEVTTPMSGSAILTFSPSDGDYVLGDDPSSDVWVGELDLDLAVEATRVRFTLDNTLLTGASDGGTALIKKKDGDIQIEIIVPEPATGGMALLGLLGMVGACRRRLR